MSEVRATVARRPHVVTRPRRMAWQWCVLVREEVAASGWAQTEEVARRRAVAGCRSVGVDPVPVELVDGGSPAREFSPPKYTLEWKRRQEGGE